VPSDYYRLNYIPGEGGYSMYFATVFCVLERKKSAEDSEKILFLKLNTGDKYSF